MFRNEDHHWWFVARRRIVQKVLDSYLPDAEKRRILEVGCGSGGNLELLSTYGTLYAMELDDYARELANTRGACLVEKGSMPDNIPFLETFDLICMLDVLEHIEDDVKALREIGNKLNPSGKLLLTVPAFEFLWSAHDVALAHKRRYGKKQLIELLGTAGFKTVYSTYFNSFLFPVIAATRFFNHVMGTKDGTDVKMPSCAVNALLTKMLSSEKLFMPGMSLPVGVSLLFVAEKINKGPTPPCACSYSGVLNGGR